MVKLVYTTDSKSVAFGRGGSSPPTGTTYSKKLISNDIGFFYAFNFFVSGRNSEMNLIRFAIILLTLPFLTSCAAKWEPASQATALEELKSNLVLIDEMSEIQAFKYLDDTFAVAASASYNSRFRVTFNLPDTMAPIDWLRYLSTAGRHTYSQRSTTSLEWTTEPEKWYHSIRYSLHQKRYIYTHYCYDC